MMPAFASAKAPDGSDRSAKAVSAALRGVAVTALDTNALSDGDEREGEDEGNETAQHEAEELDVNELFQIAVKSESQSVTYMQTAVRPKWARATKAYHNEHFEGSKYNSDQWRGRSKVFRPKTRSAVRKGMTNAAKALFGPGDVVAIVPQNEGNQFQTASAAIKQELMNYRLSRTTKKNGIRWFQISMGARQDSMVYGVCISKQVWRYRRETMIDRTTGMQTERVAEDKPDVALYAPENVLFSPTCDWTNPAQSSEYLILRHPMSVSDAMTMLKNNSKKPGGVIFDTMTEAELRTYAAGNGAGPVDTMGTRAARHDNADPNQRTTDANPVVWMDEVFLKVDGVDVVFWKLGSTRAISNAVEVVEEYPAYGGERPVVIGFGALEPHRPYPMSSVESWQQLQQEINDNVNLRLDHMKQVVTPLAKVKRGQKVDLKQVQARGSNSNIVMLNNMDDVDWAQIPDVPQSAFVENNYLNADFDDLSGSFNTGTVQTNRSLNETVGGMKLLASDANAVGEFDLSVWVETWVEPVLWQVLKLEEYYESDAMVLAIAGEKAKLYEKFGISDITDTLLQAETNLTIKVGMGVTNLPQERLQKFMMASKALGEILAPFVQSGIVKMPTPRVKELTNTIYGDAGIPDAAERFFMNMDDESAVAQQDGPPPEVQLKQQELQMKQQEGQGKLALQAQKIQLDKQKLALDAHRSQQDMAMRQREGDRQFAQGAVQHAQQAYDSHQQGQLQAQQQAAGQGGDMEPAEPQQGEAGGIEQQVAQIGQAVMQLAQNMAAMQEQVGQLGAGMQRMLQQNGPKKIVRDEKTGEAIGMMVGGKLRPLKRDGQNRIIGIA